MSDPTSAESQDAGYFVQELTRHQQGLLGYALSLCGNLTDAEEVLQETNARLWEQREKYDTSRGFMPWACTICYYMVLAQRTKKRRERMQFNQEVVEVLAEESAAMTRQQNLSDRQHALAECVQKLSASHRQMLDLCYEGGLKIREVARRIGKSEAATYKALARVRQSLHDCVERILKTGGVS
ncbi:MAG: sigma-70 family RNA polymerase sigma factor [Phycisphaeraceae bacterium]|nr:sigma-70 family RNA polymerase sigma factor [Phycisphaeraceae bacterium]